MAAFSTLESETFKFSWGTLRDNETVRFGAVHVIGRRSQLTMIRDVSAA
jgi:hypothetical protein